MLFIVMMKICILDFAFFTRSPSSVLIRINFGIVFGIGNGFASDGDTCGSATVDNIRSDGVLGSVGIGMTTVWRI